MKKKKLYRLLSFGMILLSGASLVSYVLSLSWFIQEKIVQSKADGFAYPDYFAYGDGSEAKPYGISNKRHLYNLAWLQDLGHFDDKTYYFELAKDVDMEGLEIPPIGTESHPFKGHFDGKNYVVKNAKIVDTLPPRHPVNVSSYTSPKILGFFGCIGRNPLDSSSSSSTSTKNPNAVENFYLDNVEIASTGPNVLTGLIAGYVGGNLTNAGVHYGKLTYASGTTNINNFSTISHYVLIGDYDESKYKWTDKPGDAGYGASLDVQDLYTRTNSVLKNTGKDYVGNVNKYQYLPFKGTGEQKSDSFELKDGSVTYVDQPNKDSVTYVGQLAAKGNIGYYAGSSVKTYDVDVTKTTSSYYTIFNSAGTIEGTYIYSVDISKDDNLYKQTKGRTYSNNLAKMIRLQNGLEVYDGKSDRMIVIKNAVIGNTSYDSIKIPARCVWVKPSQAGTLRFVLVADSSDYNFSLRKLERSTPGDLTTGWVGTGTVAIGFDANKLPDPSTVSRIDGIDKASWPEEKVADMKKDYIAYVLEKKVSEEDVKNNVEYVVNNQGNKNGVYIWYLDLGQNGSSADIEGSIEKIDFVIANSEGTLVKIGDSAYKASNAVFSITGKATDDIIYSFRRPSEILGVLYYPASSSGTVITPDGKGTTGSASDDSCKEKGS